MIANANVAFVITTINDIDNVLGQFNDFFCLRFNFANEISFVAWTNFKILPILRTFLDKLQALTEWKSKNLPPIDKKMRKKTFTNTKHLSYHSLKIMNDLDKNVM